MFFFNDDRNVTNNTTNITNVTQGDNSISQYLQGWKDFMFIMAIFWIVGILVYMVVFFPLKTAVWYSTGQKAPYSRVFFPHCGFMAQSCYGALFSLYLMTLLTGIHVGDFDYKSTILFGYLAFTAILLWCSADGIIKDVYLDQQNEDAE